MSMKNDNGTNGDIRCVAKFTLVCWGDGNVDPERALHAPGCEGYIPHDSEYMEVNPQPDKYGSRHCFLCYQRYFE